MRDACGAPTLHVALLPNLSSVPVPLEGGLSLHQAPPWCLQIVLHQATARSFWLRNSAHVACRDLLYGILYSKLALKQVKYYILYRILYRRPTQLGPSSLALEAKYCNVYRLLYCMAAQLGRSNLTLPEKSHKVFRNLYRRLLQLGPAKQN